MSIQEHVCISARNGSALAKRASGLSLAVLLLSGILHATPITSVGESQLENSKQLASRSVAPPAIPADVDHVTDNVLVPHSNTEASVQPATACILSSDCSTTVQVPEPQSLVLVGSGLLSMAGLIRRRLLR
ncbi:MAG TPA: PEP-CTERM sorting domain-containing protein [Candidatus Dormibacteraeota bacterium]|jgi:hypothetical protein|nr:PEP-CTERM sorting domain-containing protein [Candidatus Dormibacteraeota bacterium]